MGSIWGNFLKVSIFGESHGPKIGAVVDGFPQGFLLNMETIMKDMDRRAPGKSKLTTGRKEADLPVVVSGILNGKTTGAPLCVLIENKDTKSGDYANFLQIPRPSHSDFTGSVRYNGYNDLRGSGHFSGRLTAPLVFVGAICKAYLKSKYGISIQAKIESVGNHFNRASGDDVDKAITDEIEAVMAQGDSIGGVIGCNAKDLNIGIGSPIFDNVESRISSIIFSIPGVKGIEFGDGFTLTQKTGSEVNDCFTLVGDRVETKTNHSGGIMGGITTGMPIELKVAMKPTPSISREQTTLNVETGKEEIMSIKGRHDPCIALRAPVVVEAAVAIAIMDLYLEAYGYDIR